MAKRVVLVALASAPAALAGCSSSEIGPPTKVTMVTSGGFIRPGDAVSSPDGKTFYFTAFSDQLDENDQRLPAIYKVSSEPGSIAEPLVTGAPLRSPTGLVMSCDGGTLYVADLLAGEDDGGAVFALPTAGGALADLGAGIARATGLAMRADCKTLHVTGRTAERAPAVFTLPAAGGAAAVLYSGEPLLQPSGIHVDGNGVSWVMDQRAQGTKGQGVLWAIPADGSIATEVASDLRMGMPGGVSLIASGGVAVMPTRDADDQAQLTTVVIATGETSQLPVADMAAPAGIRTARDVGVMAVVDADGAIYRADDE
ncbi:MAG: hypothetical protein KF773_38420 [Deltaproteobacteria bacterium]|nr:hypothetical protein [Deltaproteobacteria bacterium]MCW5803593.1 hypothetical protein [Deltaproteobacteria bacterium]